MYIFAFCKVAPTCECEYQFIHRDFGNVCEMPVYSYNMNLDDKMDAKLCDCFSDMSVCCLTLWCPLIVQSQNFARSRDEECEFCHCCAYAHPLWTRTNIRRKKNQSAAMLKDYCTYCFCFPCAVCQDARELNILDNSTTIDYLNDS